MIFLLIDELLGSVNDVIITNIGNDAYKLSIGPKILDNGDESWYFIRDENTKYSTFVLKNITLHDKNQFAAYGRFDCYQNLNFQFNSEIFSSCMPIPIFKSGVLVGNSIFSLFNNLDNVSLLEMASVFSKSNIDEQMNFHYFGFDHGTRGNDFLASFWSLQENSLDQKYIHAAGLKLDFHITNHAVAQYIIGKGLFFQNSKINDYPNIELACTNISSYVESTNEIIYSQDNVVNIYCDVED